MDAWPFDDPPNLAVITVRQIVHDGHPVLLVVHDADDGGWQFLSGGTFDVSDGWVISLAGAIARDRSLAELADLPLGWQTWRAAPGAPWRRGSCQEGDASRGDAADPPAAGR